MKARQVLQALYLKLRHDELPCPVCGEPIKFSIDYTPASREEPESYEEYFSGDCLSKDDAAHFLLWNTDPAEHIFGYGQVALANHAKERQELCDWLAQELMILDGVGDSDGETFEDTEDSRRTV
jgi:hypothetical protein